MATKIMTPPTAWSVLRPVKAAIQPLTHKETYTHWSGVVDRRRSQEVGGAWTHLLPQLGMPTAWMIKMTTWQKKTKKKKKKLTELSDLKKDQGIQSECS